MPFNNFSTNHCTASQFQYIAVLWLVEKMGYLTPYDCTSVGQKESRRSRVYSLNLYESAGLFHNFVSVSACADVRLKVS